MTEYVSAIKIRQVVGIPMSTNCDLLIADLIVPILLRQLYDQTQQIPV